MFLHARTFSSSMASVTDSSHARSLLKDAQSLQADFLSKASVLDEEEINVRQLRQLRKVCSE